MLISISGLPGAGKTTIAREVARQIDAVHLEVDSIERALRDSGFSLTPQQRGGTYLVAYRIAEAVALDNLQLGRTVIADAVNPVPLTRDLWLHVAKAADVPLIEIEIVCSNQTERRQRCKRGAMRPSGDATPRWERVSRVYQEWDREHVIVDTAARTAAETVGDVLRVLRA